MDFCILGPLEVSANGELVALGGPKQRALLAILLLNAGRVVSRDRLIEALWAERPHGAAHHAVEVNVSRLRKRLGATGDGESVLVTRAPGYVLHVEPERVDLQRFERLLAEGRRAASEGNPERAASALREAEAQWRGRPLADLEFESFARTDVERLEELKLTATEERVEAELALGHDAELVAELRQLTREQPWRERLHAQLMLALYRSGRQADALQAFGDAREVLVEELGIEPGAQLTQLHHAMLAQDLWLDSPGESVAPNRPGLHSRLPAPPNRTVGREQEIAAVAELLLASSVRLLTLTGPGGVGKTRLALEVARSVETDFADGACLVSLAAVQRVEDVPAAVVRALGIIVLEGESPIQAVERFLASKHLLLVTDNFEHVLGAAPFIGDLLSVCSTLTVLATSREALNVRAEQRHPVPPLALPDIGSDHDTRTLAGFDAVALFAERARARDPAFALRDGEVAAVAEICRRIDGLPLAIELAAARCGLLTPDEIAARLDTALGPVGAGARDAPKRHQTLHATIDWSHELLTEEEQTCFARFAVFAGGATVEAAATITDASLDTLDQLVAKSLVVRRVGSVDTPSRLGMLETIGSYAGERFAAATDDGVVRERHCRHFLALAERHGSERAIYGGHSGHLVELDAEIENLHAALTWAVGRDTAESALALCAALGEYWLMRMRYADALGWIDRALSLPGADADPALRVRVLCIKAWTLWPLGRDREHPAVTAEAEALARAVADPVLLAQVLQVRSMHASAHLGRFDVAETLAEEALYWARVAADDWWIAMAASATAIATQGAAEPRERVDRAAALLEQAGNVYQVAELLAGSAYTALCNGSLDDASEFVGRAIPLAERLDAPFLRMLVRGNFALVSLLTGDIDAARRAFREELALCREQVVPPMAEEGLKGLAAVAAACGDSNRAARLCGAAHRYGQEPDAVDARLQSSYFRPARSCHGPDAWDAAVREGAALSLDDAFAYALEDTGA